MSGEWAQRSAPSKTLSPPSPPSSSSPPAQSSPAEFRPYRRFVTLFVLTFVFVGTAYLTTSVSVSIYRRRNPVPTGERLTALISEKEVKSCYEELGDVMSGLQKHLEKFHHLLGGYDPAEAQRWGDEGGLWRGQWRALGQRCRFGEIRPARLRKEFEEMAGVYDDLGETHRSYTDELTRFGRQQAPRLDRIRLKLRRIGERLSNAAAPSGEESR